MCTAILTTVLNDMYRSVCDQKQLLFAAYVMVNYLRANMRQTGLVIISLTAES